MITLMTLLAISCKKEDIKKITITPLVEEIKDNYFAIEDPLNGFGILYFKTQGSNLYVYFQDINTNISYIENSDNFKILGDSSITVVVSERKSITLNFNRNVDNEISFKNCSYIRNNGVGLNFFGYYYTEMYSVSKAPFFYIKNTSLEDRIGYNFNIRDYSFINIEEPKFEIISNGNFISYTFNVIGNNLGFASSNELIFGISVPYWKNNNKISLLVQTKDALPNVALRNLHDVAIRY